MKNAIGLMSGTSLDGVDIAAIRTDGAQHVECEDFDTVAYPDGLRQSIHECLGGHGAVESVERDLTLFHAVAVRDFLNKFSLSADQIDVVGFHGHTILHKPEQSRTWQIGDGQFLADETGLRVVCDMRSNDVAHGGQGAPLAPLYHFALAAEMERPIAVLNIGGVANVTWIGAGEEELLAFDTGPGGAQLDEWVESHTGAKCDFDGELAAAGRVDAAIVQRLVGDTWFDMVPPKSLDRIDFSTDPVKGLKVEDGAATLTAFSVEAIATATKFFPAPVKRWLVTGGGRNNPVMMQMIRDRLDGAVVEPVEVAGWNGDALEAEAFAYLAVRSLQGLPLTVPGTTGVSAPMTGGTCFEPKEPG